MLNFIDGGSFEIQNGYGHDGSLIFKAATTCYRNENDTKKTADDFIQMLKKNKHTAMLEFMWIVLKFDRSKYEDVFADNNDFSDYIASQLMVYMSKYIDVTNLNNGEVLISGNARAFYELIDNILTMHDDGVIDSLPAITVDTMLALQNLNGVLFSYGLPESWGISRCEVLKEGDKRIIDNPTLDWHMVKFHNVSRGFTHEEVRHRVMSFAQTSTRYVDHTNMDIIFPLSDIPEDSKQRIKDAFATMQAAYTDLINKNVSKGIARQLLPTGIAADICVAGTRNQWEAMFALRTADDAHWEIRNIMLKLQTEL